MGDYHDRREQLYVDFCVQQARQQLSRAGRQAPGSELRTEPGASDVAEAHPPSGPARPGLSGGDHA